MNQMVFGIIVSTRGFFNPELARQGRIELLATLEAQGYRSVILPADDTPSGAVETVEDAAKCARLFQQHRDAIDGIIICLPNFGDEVGVVNAVHMADLKVPVLVQACDDDLSKLAVDERRDAFCGKLSVCNNLYQYGIPFTNTTLHTCAITSAEFAADLKRFARVCRVVRGLRSARIAQIGTRPAPFQTVRYSEKLLQRAGITVVPVDLSQIIARANTIKESAVLAERIADMRAYGQVTAEVTADALDRSARLMLSIEQWMKENHCVAGAIQCWDSIQQNYGCATCLPMSMLTEQGTPMACEVDITGAVSMYALYLASGQPAGYLDWNNNYADDRDRCICIHCSAYAKSFIGTDFELSPLDILGASLGRAKCFGACKANIAPGPMTFAKLTTDDPTGAIKAYVGEGEFTADPVRTPGGVATCRVPRLQELLDYLCRHGFEHHVAMNRSLSANVLREALGTYLGFDVYRHP